MADMARHLEAHGPRDWGALRAKHPAVPKRTFFRWLRQVRDRELPAENIRLTAKRVRGAETKDLSPALSSEHTQRHRLKAVPKLDSLSAVREAWRDIISLRELAMRPARVENGEVGPQIKNPRLFAATIKRRLDLIEKAVALEAEVYSPENMEKMWDVVIEAIAAAEPQKARSIMSALAELNARWRANRSTEII
jgi:hypothetical protein